MRSLSSRNCCSYGKQLPVPEVTWHSMIAQSFLQFPFAWLFNGLQQEHPLVRCAPRKGTISGRCSVRLHWVRWVGLFKSSTREAWLHLQGLGSGGQNLGWWNLCAVAILLSIESIAPIFTKAADAASEAMKTARRSLREVLSNGMFLDHYHF